MRMNMHGVVKEGGALSSGDYLFRLSLKALIRNDRGEVLLVKESGRTWWDMPGGGMDHSDNFHSGLARELEEEIAYR